MGSKTLDVALLADALTTCQTALGVIRAPQILPNRFTLPKIVPAFMPAAVVHSSTAYFAHNGTGNGADVLSVAHEVGNHPALFANLEILCSESN